MRLVPLLTFSLAVVCSLAGCRTNLGVFARYDQVDSDSAVVVGLFMTPKLGWEDTLDFVGEAGVPIGTEEEKKSPMGALGVGLSFDRKGWEISTAALGVVDPRANHARLQLGAGRRFGKNKNGVLGLQGSINTAKSAGFGLQLNLQLILDEDKVVAPKSDDNSDGGCFFLEYLIPGNDC